VAIVLGVLLAKLAGIDPSSLGDVIKAAIIVAGFRP
jgi:hypothetical protein